MGELATKVCPDEGVVTDTCGLALDGEAFAGPAMAIPPIISAAVESSALNERVFDVFVM